MDDNKTGKGDLDSMEATWRNDSANVYKAPYKLSEMVIKLYNASSSMESWNENTHINQDFIVAQQMSPHPASSYAAMMIFAQVSFTFWFHDTVVGSV